MEGPEFDADVHPTEPASEADVPFISWWCDVYRIKQSSNPKIGSSLRDLIAADAQGLATNDYFVNHGLMPSPRSGISTNKDVLVEVVGDTNNDLQEVLERNGFETLSCYKHVCSLHVYIADIDAVARLPQVTRIKSSGDLDIYLAYNGTIVYSSTNANIGQEPIEVGFLQPGALGLLNPTIVFSMYIVHNSGPRPKFMKVILTASTGRLSIYEFPTDTTTLVGSPINAGGAAVGSVLFETHLPST